MSMNCPTIIHQTILGPLEEAGRPDILSDHATQFFLRVLSIRNGDRVAEPGCGTGVLSIFAAMAGASLVTGTDVSPEAISYARSNAIKNGQNHIHFTEGHLLEPVTEPLDLVIALLPHKPAPRPFNTRFYGGMDGTDLLLETIKQAQSKLVPGGRLVLYVNSIAHPRKVLQEFSRSFSVKTLGEKKRPFTRDEFEALTPGMFNHLEEQRRKGEAEFDQDAQGFFFTARIYEGTRR